MPSVLLGTSQTNALLGQPKPKTLLGTPKPSKWAQTADILAPYVTGPYNAMTGLMTTPLEVLLGGGTPEQQDKAVADSFNAAATFMGGSSVVPKPRNALNMGVKLWHGSPQKDLDALVPGPEGTGALGPGVYGTPAHHVAQRYGENVYSFEAPDEMFLGAGKQWDDIPSDVSSYQVWRDQVEKMATANPEHADTIRAAGDKMLYDGYPFFRELAYKLGSKEKAQEIYKKSGFKGLTAMVDGPEAVIFDSMPLSAGQR